MLMTILCLIGLVLVAMVAARFFGHQDQSSNRYKRRRQKSEPRLKRVAPTFSDAPADSDDPDEILGIKSVETAQVPPQNNAPKIISIYLVAPAQQSFGGYDMLQAILATGLRYGDMKIFHRHQQRNGKGPVLFSLSSISEPGTFDLANIGSFSCRGFCLFLRYDSVSDPEEALHEMIATAQAMQEDLGGAVLASDRQPLNEDVIAYYEQMISHFVKHHTDEVSH